MITRAITHFIEEEGKEKVLKISDRAHSILTEVILRTLKEQIECAGVDEDLITCLSFTRDLVTEWIQLEKEIE
jgi:hypothetical protein